MLNKEEINTLIQKLISADDAYYNTGHPLISDQEYDSIRATVKAADPEHPYFEKVGEIPSSLWEKAPHEIPMGSLDKVHTEQEFIKWAEKFPGETFIIQPKMDGLSLDEKYKNWKLSQAITRGDGVTGEDITVNVKRMGPFQEPKTSPIKQLDEGNFSARCEIILNKNDLDRINSIVLEKNDTYKNCRNAASGLSRRLDGKHCKFLTRYYYDILTPHPLDEYAKIHLLKTLGFPSLPYALGDIKMVISTFNHFKETRDSLDYNIDGMVIKINSWEKQQELGSNKGRPRGQIAWKFDPPSAATYLRKVTWEVGRTGVITPLGWVDPVEIEGSTISKVTLHNIAEIKRLWIGIDDLVMIIKAGDIIPKVTAVMEHQNKPLAFEVPTRCPCCNELLVNDDIRLMCVNDHCDAKNFQRIMNFIKTTKIDGFGEALAEKLFDVGKLRLLSDFFKLKAEDIAGIEGWGEKSAHTILANVEGLRSMDPATFLASMGIPSLSTSTAEDLWAKYGDIEKILQATVEDICTIKGYQVVSATKIVEGLRYWAPQIKSILEHIKLKTNSGGKLTGQSFCFTGEMSQPRSFFQGLVTKYGGKSDSTVTKTTTYLVCNENKGSSKSRKAEQYGVKIINEQQFLDLAGEVIPQKPKLVTKSLFEEE